MAKKTTVKKHDRIGTDGVKEHSRTLPDAPMGEQKGTFDKKGQWKKFIDTKWNTDKLKKQAESEGTLSEYIIDLKFETSELFNVSESEVQKYIDDKYLNTYTDNPDLSRYKTKGEALQDLVVRQGADYDETVDYVNNNWGN